MYFNKTKAIISSTLNIDPSSDISGSIKDRIVECLKTFQNSINNFYYLFSSEYGMNQNFTTV